MGRRRSFLEADDFDLAALVEARGDLLDGGQLVDELHAQEKPTHDKVTQEQVDAISALLTPPQKIAYDKWREERARLHAKQQQNQQKK